MEVFKVVPTLETLAIAAAYKAIQNDLSLCYGHGPAGKRFYLDCSESDQIRRRVRSRLDQTLVGIVNDKVRRSFLYTHYNNSGSRRTYVDAWLFADCVLCDTLEKLGRYVVLDASDQLITIISKRSPFLKKLALDFEKMDLTDFSPTELGRKLSAALRPLASLRFLTDLDFYTSSSEASCIMGLIGDACPSLSSLSAELQFDGDEDYAEDENMLALVMGRFANFFKSKDLPSWCEHGEPGRIDVPNEYRTPICSSLREIYVSGGMSAAATAFTLRNIPWLNKFEDDTTSGKSRGIEMIHHQQQQEIHYSFQGKLSLTVVGEVNVKSRRSLMAIGDLCPSLNEASFGYRKVDADDLVSPDEAQTILNKWPKLTDVSLSRVSRKYVRRILEVFGPELLRLSIYGGAEDLFSLADFALCPKLENLRFHDCILDENEDVTAFDPSTFLPHLKSIYSSSCLGSHSRFFEEKSSLVRLDVNCSHLGLEMKKGCPTYAKVESGLKRIRDRETWSQLETLIMRQFTGLSMDMLVRLFPQLRRLKEVILPQTICCCDVLLYESIKKELSNRKPPVKISFRYFKRMACFCFSYKL